MDLAQFAPLGVGDPDFGRLRGRDQYKPLPTPCQIGKMLRGSGPLGSQPEGPITNVSGKQRAS